MNRIGILLCAFVVFTASARCGGTEGSLESELNARLGKTSAPPSRAVKPNEIVKGKINYSGIAVEALKTGHPLQLINPAAPPEYGSPQDNVLPDTYNGRNHGWKLFSIGF
jgi:hypothetical protein